MLKREVKFNREKLLEKINKEGKKGSNYIWKPIATTTGKHHLIRIFPYQYYTNLQKESEEYQYLPFIYFHYGIGKEPSIICLEKNFGEPCPICEFVEQLREPNMEKEAWKAMMNISAKPNTFAPVYIRGILNSDGTIDETVVGAKTAKYWRLTDKTYNTICQIVLDTEVNDVTDPEEGYDLKIKYILGNTPGNDTQYPLIEVKEMKRPSKLAKTEKEVEEIASSLPSLFEIYQKKTYQEITLILKKWKSSDSGEIETEEIEDDYTKTDDKNDSNDKLTEDIDNDLNKLLS